MMAKILDITPAEYHAIDAFSSSCAKTLISKSAKHAKYERDHESDEATREMDFGAVAHRLVLGKGADYKVLDHADYRKDVAKADRDVARKAGLVPILAHAYERASTVAEAVRVELAELDILLDGQSELVITWDEETRHGVVPCKAMLDHVWLERGRILELKVTGDAEYSAVERTSENLGYAIGCTAYTRALEAIAPSLIGRVQFLFAFAESDEPFALNVCKPDGAFRELGDRRWRRALETWAKCRATGVYPAYGGINVINPPAWVLRREGFSTEEM